MNFPRIMGNLFVRKLLNGKIHNLCLLMSHNREVAVGKSVTQFNKEIAFVLDM